MEHDLYLGQLEPGDEFDFHPDEAKSPGWREVVRHEGLIAHYKKWSGDKLFQELGTARVIRRTVCEV